MAKKTQTQTSEDVSASKEVSTMNTVPVEGEVDELLLAYQAAEAVSVARHTVAGRNVPYADVKKIVSDLQKKVKGPIVVSAARDAITSILKKQYEAMETGMDRVQVRVGTEIVTMTKTELKELRMSQFAFSVKEGNVYRLIYQVVKKGNK